MDPIPETQPIGHRGVRTSLNTADYTEVQVRYAPQRCQNRVKILTICPYITYEKRQRDAAWQTKCCPICRARGKLVQVDAIADHPNSA
jgi:hypothetical protein